MADQNNTPTTRRRFLGVCGVIGAGLAIPHAAAAALAGEAAPARDATRPLDVTSRWYTALVDNITKAWEPRFRHRQYRPGEDGDYEGEIAPPRFELENALMAAIVQDDARRAALIVSASPSLDDVDDSAGIVGAAESALTADVLAHAEQLGYFATPCPEHLRFPSLPEWKTHFRRDDLEEAEAAVDSAKRWLKASENCERVYPDMPADEEIGLFKGALAEAEERLADMKSGKVICLTAEEKSAAHAQRRRDIIAAYAARLEASGAVASWVDLTDAGWAALEERRA